MLDRVERLVQSPLMVRRDVGEVVAGEPASDGRDGDDSVRGDNERGEERTVPGEALVGFEFLGQRRLDLVLEHAKPCNQRRGLQNDPHERFDPLLQDRQPVSFLGEGEEGPTDRFDSADIVCPLADGSPRDLDHVGKTVDLLGKLTQ